MFSHLRRLGKFRYKKEGAWLRIWIEPRPRNFQKKETRFDVDSVAKKFVIACYFLIFILSYSATYLHNSL